MGAAGVAVAMATTTGMVALLPASPVAAATLVVTTAADVEADDGLCSLREAIINANTDSVAIGGLGECGAGSGTDTIEFNIGVGGPHVIELESALPAITSPVTIDGYTEPGAQVNTALVGTNAQLQVAIDGRNTLGSGLIIQAPNTTVRGLAIYGFGTNDNAGIVVESPGATIAGNWIGVGFNGATPAIRNQFGVLVTNSSDVTIGGNTQADANLISGNLNDGVYIEGNSINTFVSRNLIGTNAAGTSSVRNGNGVCACAVSGGFTSLSRNLISGNAGAGVFITSFGTSIISNLIGTDRVGLSPVPNGLGGIVSGSGAAQTLIGDGTPANRNVIGGHAGNPGITLGGATELGTEVRGNFIGVGADGFTPIGNSRGVLVTSAGATDVQIGGTEPGDGNVIANNLTSGVVVTAGTGTSIVGNFISDHPDRGIVLFGNTLNDPGDADVGPNNFQNWATLLSATAGGTNLVVEYSIDSAPSSSAYPIAIDVYTADSVDGDGSNRLGRVVAPAPGTYTANLGAVDVPGGTPITATATDADGNTSEFSFTVTATAATPPDQWTTTSDTFDGPTMSSRMVNDGLTGPVVVAYDNFAPLFGGGGASAQVVVSAVADTTGTVELSYVWSGFHAFFGVTAELEAFVIGPGRNETIPLVDGGPADCCTPPSAGFTYNGNVELLNLNAGDEYGFRIRGSNGDLNSRLRGTLVVDAQSTLRPDLRVVNGFSQTRVDDGDGLFGAAYSGTRDIITGPGFGDVDGFGTDLVLGQGIDVVSRETLMGTDIFVLGEAAGAYTVAELAALQDFVAEGGTLIATASATSSQVASAFGLDEVQESDGASTFMSNTHEIADGPFGEVTGFASNPANPAETRAVTLVNDDAVAVARDANGRITIAEIRATVAAPNAGLFLFVGDPNLLGAGASANATLVSNLFAFAAGFSNGVIPPTLDFSLELGSETPDTVAVAPRGIAVDELDRGAISAAGGGRTSVAAAPITAIGPQDTGLASITIADTPLKAVVLDSAPLKAVPLVSIGVGEEGGWPALLARSELANEPLSAVTFGEALLDPIVGPRVEELTIASITVEGTPLKAVPVAALVLGATPLKAVPLKAVGPNEPNPWCELIEPLLEPGQTCEQALDELTLLEVSVRGVPLKAVEIAGIPLKAVDLAASPLKAVPLKAVPLESIQVGNTTLAAIPLKAVAPEAIPLKAVPAGTDVGGTPLADITVSPAALDQIVVDGVTVAGTPLKAVPLKAVPLKAVDVAETPLKAVPLKAVPLKAVPLKAVDLYPSPLKAVPLKAVDIQRSAFAAVPLKAVGPGAAPLKAVRLSALPLTAIPLKAVPLDQIVVDGRTLGATPLKAVDVLGSPLKAVPVADLLAARVEVDCTRVDCTSGTLGDAYLRGAIPDTLTLAQIQSALGGISLGELVPYLLGITAAQIQAALANGTLTINDLLSLDEITLGDLPGTLAALDQVTIGDIVAALDGVTYADVVGAVTNFATGRPYTAQELVDDLPIGLTVEDLTDFGSMTFGDLLDAAASAQPPLTPITIDDLAPLLAFIDVATFQRALGVVLDLRLLPDNLTLGSLTDEELGQLTLLDLLGVAVAEDVTLGELLTELGLAGVLDEFTLGDLLLALIDPASRSLAGDIEFERVDVSALPPGVVADASFTADFSIGGNAARTVVVEIALPATASYVAGSSFIREDGAVLVQNAEPTIQGNVLSWTVVARPGSFYRIGLEVRPTVRLGVSSLAATARVVGTDIAVPATAGVSVVDGLEPNDFDLVEGSTREVTPAVEDVVYLTYVGDPTDIDVFRIDVAENEQLAIDLSNLPADYDLALWGPGRAGGAALSPQSGESPLIPITDPDADDVDAQPLDDFPRLDARVPSLRLVATSNAVGTARESITTDRLPAGTYFVQVYGANGASSPDPAALQLQITPADAVPACSAIGTLPTVTPPDEPFISPAADTLILVNESRLEQFHGAQARADVNAATARLTAYLAANPQFGLVPVVVPVDAYPSIQAAYAAWDAGCDSDAANAVVAEINRTIIDPLRGQLEHIVILGPDEQIPMARVVDATQIANEFEYRDEFTGDILSPNPNGVNAFTSAFWDSRVRTDEPYGDAGARSLGDRFLYVSDVALGRVVETPADIVDALDRFAEFQGTLDIDTATVLGYDFLSDGSAEIASEIRSAEPTLPVDDELADGFVGTRATGRAWDKDDATAELIEAGTKALVSLNAHFDHYRALPAVGDKVPGFQDNLIAAEVADALGDDALAQSLVFSMGCHSGLSVSDVMIRNTNVDWAQTMNDQEALYVANTGFGYGDTVTVAYTEELMRLFAENVTSPFELPEGTGFAPSTVGQALMWAKNRFVAELQTFSVYDEKAVMESTFYGLPFYRVGLDADPLPQPPQITPVPDSTGTPSNPVGTSVTNTPVPTPAGTYYANTDASGDELVIVAPGRPIQPKTVVDVSVVSPTDPAVLDQIARGAIIVGMQSRYVPAPNPVIATPIFDESGVPEPDAGNVAFPTKPLEITRSTGPAGDRQQLVLATGQYRSDPGVQRLDDRLDVVVYYAAPGATDFTEPTIRSVESEIVGGRLALSVEASDLGGGVDRVYVLVVENPGSGSATWRGLDLVRSPGTDRWTGSLVLGPSTTEVEFIVQAKDSTGNVGFATNKARNFNAEPPAAAVVPPPEMLTAGPTAEPGPGGFYLEPVTIEVTSSSPATYTLNGVPRGPVSSSFTITDDGPSTWTVTTASGYTTSGIVVIDTLAPEVTSDTAPGALSVARTVTISAADAGAGVTSLTYRATGAENVPETTIDGLSASIVLDTEGTTTITAEAIDAAGNSSGMVTFVYSLDEVPTVTGSLSTPPNAAGWNNEPVVVSWSVDDPAVAAPPDVNVFGEGRNQRIRSAPACDAAGNCGVGRVIVSLDLTAPDATLLIEPAANAFGWNNTDVTVTVECSDALSGVVCPAPITLTDNGAGQVRSVSVVDRADNATVLTTPEIRIDKVPPVVTWNAPANGAEVAEESYVKPTCQVTDPLSGTDGVCTIDLTDPIVTPGRAVYTATATGTDRAGNQTTLTSTYTVLTSSTAPVIDVTAEPDANANGWWRGPVTFRFVCSDASGVATCPSPQTFSAQGANQGFTVSSTDIFGNRTELNRSGVNIDLTNPVVTVTAPTTVGPLDTVAITCAGSDALSGIDTSVCEDSTFPASTLNPGANTFVFSATDRAGNVTSVTRTITLVIPVNPAPTVRADMGVTGLQDIGFQTNIVVITGSYADPNGPGPYTASVRWNAGGAFTPLILNANGEFVAAFIYGSAGTRTVTVRICDAGGACGTDDVTVRTRVTQRIVPVRECVVDRGTGASPRYQARWGYNNPATFAIAVPSVPILENTFTSAPFLRAQPQVFLPGNQRGVFTTTFGTGTHTWRVNGSTASANSSSPRC